ncbi:MAG: dockerin type I repeat-containing protein [Muribaculaceae bacterium]|nr:dockerin type I repeat-containing protein [Muribaculaceae bacterium]
MKKTTLLFLLVLAGLTASAQFSTFEFVDQDGSVVPDGATLTITEVTQEEDVFTGEVVSVMYAGLSVRNTTATQAALRVVADITRIDGGNYQLCFPVNCMSRYEAGAFTTEAGILAANAVQDLLTEWFPDGEGACDVTMKIQVMNATGQFPNIRYTLLGDGPTITLHFRNGMPDTIIGDLDGNATVDVDDLNIIINIMLGKADKTPAADTNGDGNVDVDDMNAIINIMLGKG